MSMSAMFHSCIDRITVGVTRPALPPSLCSLSPCKTSKKSQFRAWNVNYCFQNTLHRGKSTAWFLITNGSLSLFDLTHKIECNEFVKYLGLWSLDMDVFWSRFDLTRQINVWPFRQRVVNYAPFRISWIDKKETRNVVCNQSCRHIMLWSIITLWNHFKSYIRVINLWNRNGQSFVGYRD